MMPLNLLFSAAILAFLITIPTKGWITPCLCLDNSLDGGLPDNELCPGFFFGIPLFVFFYLKAHGLSWFRSLGLALGLFIAIYGGLSQGMEMRLHPGLIYSLYLR